MAPSIAKGQQILTDRANRIFGYKELREQVGQGAFGVVDKVKRRVDGKILARKTIMFRSSDYHKFEREFKIQATLKHPHIVRLEDFDLSEENPRKQRRLTIYVEFCEIGDLDNYIRDAIDTGQKIPSDFIWRFIGQLASALAYCHNRSPPENVILHRDLKPNNIFLVAGRDAQVNIKIGDFGSAVKGPSKTQHTGDYVAPEIKHGQGKKNWSDKCDVYSVGCILYFICTQTEPFDLYSQSAISLFTDIPRSYSTWLRILIVQCCHVTPEQRPSASQLEEAASNRDVLYPGQREHLEHLGEDLLQLIGLRPEPP